MEYLISLIFMALAVIVSAYVVPGVSVASFGTALLVAFVLSILNLIVKPILIFLTLPINILTLGLFSIVINIIILAMAAAIVRGFTIDGFLAGLLFVLVLSLVTTVLGMMKK
jgi:putative membrane protein